MVVGGRYLLQHAIGQGGLGRVWRGQDQVLDRPVAVKEVLLTAEPMDGNVGPAGRSTREALAAARVSHPGIVKIHDVVQHEGSPWIVMDLIDGESLGSAIRVQRRLPVERVAAIAAQVAMALDHAHVAQVVHRDLKPENILLSGDRAVVADFGIARLLDSTAPLARAHSPAGAGSLAEAVASFKTTVGVVAGTPHYMAPEQVAGRAVGSAADMWALGATLYTALEGVPPFDGVTLADLMAAIRTAPVPPPEHAGALRPMVERLLSKDPAQRPGAYGVVRSLHGLFKTPYPLSAKVTPVPAVSPEAHEQLDAARKATQQGRPARAEASYRKAIRLQPGHYQAHSDLAWNLWKLGRHGEAEDSFREAIRLMPDNPYSHQSFAKMLAELHRYPEAESFLQEAISLKRDSADAYRELGAVLAAQHRYADAAAALQEAVRLKPGDPEALARLEEMRRASRAPGESEVPVPPASGPRPAAASGGPAGAGPAGAGSAGIGSAGAGKVIGGRYLLRHVVGEGGLGRVWRGRDQALDRPVAVKEILLPSYVFDPRAEMTAGAASRSMAVHDMLRDARAAARLSHPGIVAIHDWVQQEESPPWIVMEYVSGQSVADEIRYQHRLPWQQAATIAIQVAEALAAAHAAGIVHRYLKPGNILLSAGRAVITDVGLAPITDPRVPLPGGGTTIIFGTPGYLAPEQLDGGSVTGATDMWALGATLYTAVEGIPPFDGNMIADVLAGIRNGTPAPASHAGPLRPLLDSLLSKDPAQRPDARAVIGLLEDARKSVPPRDPAAPVAFGLVQAAFTKDMEASGHTLAGQHAQAEAALRDAIKIQPGHYRLHMRLGLALWKLERHAEAEAQFREASRLQPDSPYPHWHLGNLYAELGRLSDAEAGLRAAIRLKPDYAEARAKLDEMLRANRDQGKRKPGLFRRRKR
jgi:serine/threonine protein kinase